MSFDVLQGILSCVWIIYSDWILESTEVTLQPFHFYEVMGADNDDCKGPRNARYSKYKLLPGLFDGCHFYLYMYFNMKYMVSKNFSLTKYDLRKLIILDGGVPLLTPPIPEVIPDAQKLVPYHAKKDGKLMNCSHYILFRNMYEPMYDMQQLKALHISWFIDCIKNYELCEPL